MKKIITLILVVFLLTGCTPLKLYSETDGQIFKEEYESLNGKQNNNKTYRKLNIDEDNPFIYKEASEIIDMIENKETFVVYFGFNSCPWCRSIIPTLIEVADDLDIYTIYYVDVKEIRDIQKLNDDNTISTTKKATDDYYTLLQKLNPVLDDYTLVDNNGNEVNTNTKRIYAPNIVAVLEGIPTKMTTGISEKQTDAYMELTKEMKEETYDKIKCTIECTKELSNVCIKDQKCQGGKS